MGRIIDFHTHIFPDFVTDTLAPYVTRFTTPETFDQTKSLLKTQIRNWLRPVMGQIHRIQPSLRHLSDGMRKSIDPLAMMSTFPNLLVESTVQDLEEVLDQCNVDEAVVIAYHPYANNEWLLEVCQTHPRLIPAVQIPHGSRGAETEDLARGLVKDLADRGAKLLKIHAASDGGGADSPTHLGAIAAAADRGLPVIIHTGCIHAQTIFKDPKMGNPAEFESWFTNFPQTTFVLAHMNLHNPGRAMDMAERFPNVVLDTGWQPTEVIAEAVRRVGSDRVLMGSDWPIVGSNIQVALDRIRDGVASGLLQEYDANLILGGNAARILGRTHADSL